MFPCLGEDRYWPLTGNVGFFRAPLQKVARQLATVGRRSPWTTSNFASLSEALNTFSPFRFGAGQVKLAVHTRDGEWTVVFDAQFPGGDIAGYMSARARLDLHCEFVATKWAPESTRRLAGAAFVHYKPSQSRSRLFDRPSHTDQRWVQTSDQDGRWEFSESGEPRPFEEFDKYQVRRKAERLPVELLGRYLAAIGIPVNDESWLAGPVVAATREPFGGDNQEWSSMVELRRLCGYPEDRIPKDLVRF